MLVIGTLPTSRPGKFTNKCVGCVDFTIPIRIWSGASDWKMETIKIEEILCETLDAITLSVSGFAEWISRVSFSELIAFAFLI